ncbi:MAG TPA: hypothetical protein VG929_08460 [Actinomycetota bacterium]|nr:hypothetical protein [Actinomycetota bacterium]
MIRFTSMFLMIALLLTAQAVAAPAPTQTVEGTVLAPAPWTDDTSCFAGAQRRVSIASQGLVNGVVGYQFDVDPKTWNKKFTLESTGPAPADLDITFYYDAGFDDVGGSPAAFAFTDRKTGGEGGKVPAQTTRAIVCSYAGGQGASAPTLFHYEAKSAK